jgi:YesN/AraC family two-component response regulator
MTAVVLVDDDDAVLRNGVRVRREARSDFGIVAGAANGREAVRLVLQPQVSVI